MSNDHTDEIAAVQARIKAHKSDFEARQALVFARESAELRGELLAAVRKAREAGVGKSQIGKALGTSAYVTYNAIIEAAEHTRDNTPGSAKFEGDKGTFTLHLVNYSDFAHPHDPITGTFHWVDGVLQSFGADATFVDIEVFGDDDSPLTQARRKEALG